MKNLIKKLKRDLKQDLFTFLSFIHDCSASALAKIVFKINVMSVSARYGSFEHHVSNARNHFGEKFDFQNVKKNKKEQTNTWVFVICYVNEESKLIFDSFVLL